MSRPIADYALIGDCETAALVAKDGSIDWLCWPRFDSAACFAALLGTTEHGRWCIAPAGTVSRITRRYRGDTLVLQTDFETADGAVSLIDFMPIRKDSPVSDLVRIVAGRQGRVKVRMDLALRFDYGRVLPWIASPDDQTWRALAGPHSAILRTPAPLHVEDATISAEFNVEAGERIPFTLSYEASHLPPPPVCDPEGALRETENFWTEWSARTQYDGPYREAVTRSLITVKALTYRPTGGIVAAPTTSLPEQPGGTRNWDYRFCWLRDATFTLLSLVNAGHREEAESWCDWLLRAVAGSATQLQPFYGIGGEHRSDEMELDWLPGHGGARPVRVGNAAWSQLQIDVIGSVMDALHEAQLCGLRLHEDITRLQAELLGHLEEIWQEPDEGIWEVRSGRQHFVHSRLMSWVAFDRAVRCAEQFGLSGPVERWKTLRETIRSEILEKGFDAGQGAFVQAYGSTRLDAAALLMPIFGFLPPDDPRVVSTVDVIQRELRVDGLMRRYDSSEGADGMPESDGAFLACSFWLVDNLILQGRQEEAQRMFEHLLSLRNDVGLLAEQYIVQDQMLAGNFPQAFSHFSLIDTAFNCAGIRGAAREVSGAEQGGAAGVERSPV